MMDKCKLVVDIVVTLVRNKYSSNDAIEEKELDECITQASSFIEDGLSDIEIENIRKELHHRFLVRMNRGIKIVNTSEYKDWYNPFDIKSANSYWDRYKTYLLLGLSFPERVIDTIDNSTTDIVNLLGKPIENSCFSRKGLVIGDVQSGKTANYISVINKAADAGYKVIVLLTGTIEKLRQQTQARIDDGFIGIDTSAWERGDRNKSVGVGLINAGIEVMSFTSVIKDFNRSILRSSNVPLNTLPAPLILVAKKIKRY